MHIYRTAQEIDRLKRKIESYVRQYIPDMEIIYETRRPLRDNETAYTEAMAPVLWINEEILVAWPEEKIWKTINHELAHQFAETELMEKYPYEFPRITPTQAHNEIWERYMRILGGYDTLKRLTKEEEIYQQLSDFPKRFKLKCLKCGLTFYTDGDFIYKETYWGEPLKHPISHDTFYIEDVITRKRGKVKRGKRITPW